MNYLRKAITFISLLAIFTGCANGTQNDINKTVDTILKSFEEQNSFSYINNLTINSQSASSKNVYLLNENSDLYGYSSINTYTNAINYRICTIDEYMKNGLIYFESGDDKYNKQFTCDDAICFMGFSSIFDDARNNELINQKVSGTVNASLCAGVVRSFLMDICAFNDNYENYYFNSKIDYNLYLDLDTKRIVSIELDITDVAKLKNISVMNANYVYVFNYNEDVKTIIDENPFPTLSQDNNREYIVKQKGIDYIDDCYRDIKYVSDSLTFYPKTILSIKLSFTYESNKPNVIGHDGTYYPVSSDQEVTITVHLFYAEQEYHTTSFTFLAIPKPTQGSGDLGSQSNYLYKGRKPINEVKINFIEMHKQYGDSIYIQAGDFDMLIDAGDSSDGGYVNDFLRRNVSDGRIEMIVATHAHSDHIGGMMTALATFPNITYAVDYGYSKTDYSLVTQVRNRFKQADNYHPITDCIDNKNGARSTIYITNDFYISFLDTGYYEEPNVDFAGQEYNANMTSVAIMMTFKNQNYYFAGDLESAGETNLVNKGLISKATVAKASHHGSTTSNRTNILSKLRADVTVISTALVDRGSTSSPSKNQIHPIGNALEDIIYYSSKVYCNFTMGTVQVTCDGNNKKDVKGLGLTSPYYMGGKAVTGEENLEFKYTKWAKQYRSYYI